MKCFLIFSILAIFASIKSGVVVAKATLQIVNGTTAEDGEFPYMVQFRDATTKFRCGGAIIGPEWILTAGHCVWIGESEGSTIIYGTNKLYNYQEGSPNTSIEVKSWYLHPNFTAVNNTVPIYDVGILQLKEPIPFGELAQPIRLAEDNSEIPFHVYGNLSGWGSNTTNGHSQSYLHKINLQLLTDEECTKKINEYSNRNYFLPTHHLCSDDYYNGGCYGDSGSPYVINGIQYGVVSWSVKPCGVVPEAYSRITNPEYRNWIRNITNI